MEENVKVSIFMLSYNHKKYIKQAIESVLMQKTAFRYELVIGDDASTDGTQEILKKYQEKYPDIMKVILRQKNIGALKNSIDVKKHCCGEYIANLEGDDYWNDEEKLQKQIDFLDKNKNYIACYTDYFIRKDTHFPVPSFHQDINSFEEYLSNERTLPYIPTATLVYRNIYLENSEFYKYYMKNNLLGDRITHTLLLTKGKIKYLPIKTATYRYITKKGSSFSAMDKIKKSKDARIASKVCMCITDKKYYYLWYRLITGQNMWIIGLYKKNKDYLPLCRFYIKEMNIIEKIFYLKKQLDIVKKYFSR